VLATNVLSVENRHLDAYRLGEIGELRKQFNVVFDGIGDNLRENKLRNRYLASAAETESRYWAEQVRLEHERFTEINYQHAIIRKAHEQTFS
jgi:hypothetical protein